MRVTENTKDSPLNATTYVEDNRVFLIAKSLQVITEISAAYKLRSTIYSGIDRYSGRAGLPLITVPEVFAIVNSVQFPSRF